MKHRFNTDAFLIRVLSVAKSESHSSPDPWERTGGKNGNSAAAAEHSFGLVLLPHGDSLGGVAGKRLDKKPQIWYTYVYARDRSLLATMDVKRANAEP